MKGANVGFMKLGNEGMKVGEVVLAITDVNLNKRSLEIAEGARGRNELWKSFPKRSEVWIYKESGVELHLLVIVQEIGTCKEPFELREVAADLRGMGWIENRCVGFSGDQHVKSGFCHVENGRNTAKGNTVSGVDVTARASVNASAKGERKRGCECECECNSRSKWRV